MLFLFVDDQCHLHSFVNVIMFLQATADKTILPVEAADH